MKKPKRETYKLQSGFSVDLERYCNDLEDIYESLQAVAEAREKCINIYRKENKVLEKALELMCEEKNEIARNNHDITWDIKAMKDYYIKQAEKELEK